MSTQKRIVAIVPRSEGWRFQAILAEISDIPVDLHEPDEFVDRPQSANLFLVVASVPSSIDAAVCLIRGDFPAVPIFLVTSRVGAFFELKIELDLTLFDAGVLPLSLPGDSVYPLDQLVEQIHGVLDDEVKTEPPCEY